MTRRAPPFTIILLAAAPAVSPAWAEDPPSFAITTDTPQYCAQLAKQLTDRKSPLADVQHLLAEGRDMCDRGQTRGGIRRLRRALVILHHHRPAKEPAPKDQAAKAAASKGAASKPSSPAQAPLPKPAADMPSPPQTHP